MGFSSVALRAENAPPGFPPVPQATFADAATRAATQDTLHDTVQRLSALAEKSQDAMLRAELRLAAANVILGQQLEIPCAQAFWSLAGPMAGHPQPEDLRRLFDEASAQLAHAKDDLQEARQSLTKSSAKAKPDPPEIVQPAKPDAEKNAAPNDQRSAALKRYASSAAARRTLLAFQQALQAALLPATEDDAGRAARRAASELSALMENDNARVAAAANFWQSYLRRAEPDATAALSRLSYALDDVTSAEQPYAFFSRVLRCFVLADHDRRFAALTLLTQMEDKALGWFSDEDERARAERAIVWTRVNLLHRWYDALDADTKTEERTWCREHARKLIEARLTKPNLLPRLGPAIPMLLDAETLEGAASGTP